MEEKARDEEEDRKNREFKEEKQRQAEQVISEKQTKGEWLSSDIKWWKWWSFENIFSFESGSCSTTFAPWIDQKATREGRLWKTHSRIGSFRTRRERKSKWKGINIGPEIHRLSVPADPSWSVDSWSLTVSLLYASMSYNFFRIWQTRLIEFELKCKKIISSSSNKKRWESKLKQLRKKPWGTFLRIHFEP